MRGALNSDFFFFCPRWAGTGTTGRAQKAERGDKRRRVGEGGGIKKRNKTENSKAEDEALLKGGGRVKRREGTGELEKEG